MNHPGPLMPYLYCLMTTALYRRTRHFADFCGRAGIEQLMPQPTLEDLLAVHLSQKLPAFAVRKLRVAGIMRFSRILAVVLLFFARMATFGVRLLLPILRFYRRMADSRTRRRRVQQFEKSCFMQRSPCENLNVMFDRHVILRGHEYRDGVLRCYFEKTAPINSLYQIFVHLYPETPGVLPPDRAEHGCFCKDHYPVLEIQHWPVGSIYRDEISVSDLPPGHYHAWIGMVEVTTFRRMNAWEMGATAADLGWIRVMAPEAESNEKELVG